MRFLSCLTVFASHFGALGHCAKPSAVACRYARPLRRGPRRYRRLLGRPHIVRSVRREAHPEPGPHAPAGLSRVRGHILGVFCCDRGRSAQDLAFPGKFRVAEIALGHGQKLLSQWSLPLLSWPRIATIQGAGVAFPGARLSRRSTLNCGTRSEIGRPEAKKKIICAMSELILLARIKDERSPTIVAS